MSTWCRKQSAADLYTLFRSHYWDSYDRYIDWIRTNQIYALRAIVRSSHLQVIDHRRLLKPKFSCKWFCKVFYSSFKLIIPDNQLISLVSSEFFWITIRLNLYLRKYIDIIFCITYLKNDCEKVYLMVIQVRHIVGYHIAFRKVSSYCFRMVWQSCVLISSDLSENKN